MNHRDKPTGPADNASPEMPLTDFIGNNPVLDFHNTLAWPTSEGVNDHIRNFSDLVRWSRIAGLITKAEAARVTRDVGKDPVQGERVVVEARRLRQLLHEVLGAIAARKRLTKIAVDQINGELKRAFKSLQLDDTPTGMIWTNDTGAGAAMIVHRLAWETAQLLTSPDLDRLRSCANRECGSLFLDMSKNHSRRWCSMSDCGSRAKARRYYRRKKSAKRADRTHSTEANDDKSDLARLDKAQRR